MSRADALETLAGGDADLVPEEFRDLLPTLRVFTPQEASQILNRIKTPYWLLTKARAGLIPHTRIGETICFTLRNLVDLVEQGFRDPRRGGRPARRT